MDKEPKTQKKEKVEFGRKFADNPITGEKFNDDPVIGEQYPDG